MRGPYPLSRGDTPEYGGGGGWTRGMAFPSRNDGCKKKRVEISERMNPGLRGKRRGSS